MPSFYGVGQSKSRPISLSAPLVGIGYRPPIAGWIESCPPEIECLEVTAEHFYKRGVLKLQELAQHFPMMVHGLGLSLGTPGPLHPDELEWFAAVVETTDPLWVSEHTGFRRTADFELGHFNPVCPNEETVALFVDHLATLQDRIKKPVILENITTQLQVRGTLAETEFLNRICEQAGCGLLLDATNLYVNSRNHKFDPRMWLRDIDPQYIVQLHVVGYSYQDGQWHDLHQQAIQQDLWALIREVLEYAPVQAVILERDDNFPPASELAAELKALKQAASEAQITRSAHAANI